MLVKRQLLNQILAYLICLFLLLPLLVVLVASLTSADYLTFPPPGISGKWYAQVLKMPKFRATLALSSLLGFVVASFVTLTGFGAAYALRRFRPRFTSEIESFLLSPLLMPQIIVAIGLLFFLTRLGLIQTFSGLVIAHIVLALPYGIRAISSSLANFEEEMEKAAEILGAKTGTILIKIVGPLVSPGLIASMMFAFLISFSNVTTTLFLAGPKTETLPVLIYYVTDYSFSPDVTVMASIVLIVTLVVLIIIEKVFGAYSVIERGRS